MTPTPQTPAPTKEDQLIDKLCQQMPNTVRMDHAIAVANGRVTEAKRIIIRYIVSKLRK